MKISTEMDKFHYEIRRNKWLAIKTENRSMPALPNLVILEDNSRIF
ncbi:MAG: hypothetical protein WCD31_00550 [Gillisia sp.]